MIAAAPVRQAVVLVGGLGTRLGDLTKTTPKPLLPVAGRPFLDVLIMWLARAGVEDIILSTGYLAGTFERFLSEGHASGRWVGPEGLPIRVRESRETTPLGTAGALTLLRGQLLDRFFLINGDSFFACDLVAVASRAERLLPGHAVMTTRAVPDTTRFGRVEAEVTGRIIGFREKGVEGPGMINAGVSVLPSSVLDRITRTPFSIESEIYPALAAEGLLHAEQKEGFFVDIGLPETYASAQETLPRALKRPALFLDRDGVLNRDDHGYTHRVEDLVLMPGAGRALAYARSRGYATVVVTNQAGIGRGLYDVAAMQAFNRALNEALRRDGGWIDAFFHCAFHPEATLAEYRAFNHPDRKPNPGMLLRAASEMEIDLAASVLIGDRESDLAAAAAAGVAGVQYAGGDLRPVVQSAISVVQAETAALRGDMT